MRKTRNEAYSCPGIFFRTLRLNYVAGVALSHGFIDLKVGKNKNEARPLLPENLLYNFSRTCRVSLETLVLRNEKTVRNLLGVTMPEN